MAIQPTTRKFKFRRFSCRGDDYSEVEVTVAASGIGFRFESKVDLSSLGNPLIGECIKAGIELAFEQACVDPNSYSVTLESVRDVTAEASAAGFRACVAGAVLLCLGRGDIAPNSGLVDNS